MCESWNDVVRVSATSQPIPTELISLSVVHNVLAWEPENTRGAFGDKDPVRRDEQALQNFKTKISAQVENDMRKQSEKAEKEARKAVERMKL